MKAGRIRSAVHEAGHVVVGQAAGLEVLGAIIGRDGEPFVQPRCHYIKQPGDPQAELVLALSGKIAEWEHDQEQGWLEPSILRTLLELENAELAATVDDESIRDAALLAAELLCERWTRVLTCAAELLIHGVVYQRAAQLHEHGAVAAAA